MLGNAPAVAKKVIVIGLDGLEPTIVERGFTPGSALPLVMELGRLAGFGRRVVGEGDPQRAALTGVEGVHLASHPGRHFPLRHRIRVDGSLRKPLRLLEAICGQDS